DQVIIDDVAWGEVLRTSEIVAGSVEVHNPVIRITKLAGGSTDSAKEKKPPVIQAIKAGRIAILNPDILYRAGQGTSDASYIAKGGRIDITDWQFDLRQPNDSTRLFYATHT